MDVGSAIFGYIFGLGLGYLIGIVLPPPKRWPWSKQARRERAALNAAKVQP